MEFHLCLSLPNQPTSTTLNHLGPNDHLPTRQEELGEVGTRLVCLCVDEIVEAMHNQFCRF